MKHKQPAPPEEQPEVPTQTGDINVPDKEIEKTEPTEGSKMEKLMEMFLKISKDMEESNKKMNQELKEEIKSTKEEIAAVSYTHLDVYKRQPCWFPQSFYWYFQFELSYKIFSY